MYAFDRRYVYIIKIIVHFFTSHFLNLCSACCFSLSNTLCMSVILTSFLFLHLHFVNLCIHLCSGGKLLFSALYVCVSCSNINCVTVLCIFIFMSTCYSVDLCSVGKLLFTASYIVSILTRHKAIFLSTILNSGGKLLSIMFGILTHDQ